MKQWSTRCINCGRICTDASGRHLSVVFDSSLPTIPNTVTETVEIQWERCGDCYEVANKILETNQ